MLRQRHGPARCSSADYGDRLVFWGGGVDTQKTLPFGTPQEVRDEVRERIEIFAPGGGFVFSTIHNIQANTPDRERARDVRGGEGIPLRAPGAGASAPRARWTLRCFQWN